MLEISSLNMPMPALLEVTREPPRDAEVPTAVRETQATEPENNDAHSSHGERDDHSAPSSTPPLGSYVDETVWWTGFCPDPLFFNGSAHGAHYTCPLRAPCA